MAEKTKMSVPWKTTLVSGRGYTGGEGDLVKHGDGTWFVLCLRIGSPRQGRWYARKEDGSQWRISVARATEYVSHYEWSREKVYVGKTGTATKPAPHAEAREAWKQVQTSGTDRANEIRDRISTRRMNTQARRRAYGGFGGLF